MPTCRKDYEKCEYYHPEQPIESRCMTDLSVGYCTEEQEANKKDKDS